MSFNWKIPSGYLVAFFDEMIADTVGGLTYVPLISFFIGSCWIIISIIKDIMTDLRFLEVNNGSNKCVAELKKSFCKIIKFYADTKGYSEDSTIASTMK